MAGSNAVSRGVPRRILQGDGPSVPVISASAIPTIQYSSGNAKALQQFSRDLFSISNQFEDQQDQQVAAEAKSAGAIAGAGGDFKLQDYGTIRGRNFNEAAITTFATTLDTQGIQKMADLQNQFWNDPAGLKAGADNYINGVAQQLEKTSPEQAAAYRSRMTVRSIPAVEGAKDTAYKLTRSQADAALVENESAVRSEMKQHAADLFSDNPDRSRAATNAIGVVQNEYMKIYTANDPTTGKPLYNPEEIAIAKKKFADLTMTQGVLSWFDEQPDKAGAYMKIVNGDFKFNIDQNNSQVKFTNATQGKIRDLPVSQKWFDMTSAAAAATSGDVAIKIVSGGQQPVGLAALGKHTGSERHDVGPDGTSNTADIILQRNGKDVLPGEDPGLYAKFMENAAAAGFTGIGHYPWGIHIGMGSKAAWGPNTRENTLDPLFGAAIRKGWSEQGSLPSTPEKRSVSLADTISPGAYNSLDAEMRARIGFMNGIKEKEQTVQNKALSDAQERNSFEFFNRVYTAGSTDPTTGQPIRPMTQGEVTEGVRQGLLKPNDGQAIIKAMTTDRPQISDEPTLRDIQNRIYAGEDMYTTIIGAGDKLASKDAADLLGKNQSVVRGKNGEFSNDQKYYFNTLQDRLGQTGLFDKFDQGKADRKAMALDEYRRRVLDPANTDSPSTISNDIAARSTMESAAMDQTALHSMIVPRFAVTVPGQYRIDVQQSAKQLYAAKNAGKLTDAEFLREIANMKQWDELQTSIAKQAPAPKAK